MEVSRKEQSTFSKMQKFQDNNTFIRRRNDKTLSIKTSMTQFRSSAINVIVKVDLKTNG